MEEVTKLQCQHKLTGIFKSPTREECRCIKTRGSAPVYEYAGSKTCPVCGHDSLIPAVTTTKKQSPQQGDIGYPDSVVQSNNTNEWQHPGEQFESSKAAKSSPFGGLKLMTAHGSTERERQLLILKIAAFEHGAVTSKKFQEIKKKWLKEVVGLAELSKMEEKDKKKLAQQLFDDFIDFIYSKENLHKTVDDMRAILKRISMVETSRGSMLDIPGIPSGFIERFFSHDCPLFDNMKELVELYHDDSFRNYMKNVVDDAFTADLSGKTDNGVQVDDSPPAGSLLSTEDIT